MKELTPTYFFNLSQYTHAAIFNDCNYVWEVLSYLENYLKKCHLGRIAIKIPSGVYLVNPELITIEEGSTVEPGAYIKGPCFIGKVTFECSIEEKTYIKMLAAKAHMTLGEFVLSYIKADFPSEKRRKANKETLEAMNELKNGGGIVYETIDDFWDDMGVKPSA